MAINVQLSVSLIPVGKPWVRVAAPRVDRYIQLIDTTIFNIEFDTDSTVETLLIEHSCKAATDSSTAVIIDSISFFGISDPKFVWQGIYRPQYPALWYSQQEIKPAKELTAQNYLGWNGTYQLNFDVPVFTWMHQIQNLGWIYR